MTIADFLAPENVGLDLGITDKARLIQTLSEMAGTATGVARATIGQALQSREAFGSTGIGGGIALPHAAVPGLAVTFGLFQRLARPLPFGSVDGRPVDLVFLLLLPHADRSADLRALSAIARKLRSRQVLAALRAAPDSATAHAVLTVPM